MLIKWRRVGVFQFRSSARIHWVGSCKMRFNFQSINLICIDQTKQLICQRFITPFDFFKTTNGGSPSALLRIRFLNKPKGIYETLMLILMLASFRGF